MVTWENARKEGWHLGRCGPCSSPPGSPINKDKLGEGGILFPPRDIPKTCKADKMTLSFPVWLVAETGVGLQESSIIVISEGTNPSLLLPPFSFLGMWPQYINTVSLYTHLLSCPSKSGISELLFLSHFCHPVCVPLFIFPRRAKKGKENTRAICQGS